MRNKVSTTESTREAAVEKGVQERSSCDRRGGGMGEGWWKMGSSMVGMEYRARSSVVLARRMKLRPRESVNGRAKECAPATQLGSGEGKSGSKTVMGVSQGRKAEGENGKGRGRNGSDASDCRVEQGVVGRGPRVEAGEQSSERTKSPKLGANKGEADGSEGRWVGWEGRGRVATPSQRRADTPSP